MQDCCAAGWRSGTCMLVALGKINGAVPHCSSGDSTARIWDLSGLGSGGEVRAQVSNWKRR